MNRKWLLHFLIGVMLIIAGTACSPVDTASLSESDDDNLTLTILHTNDIHASIDDFGKVAHYIQAEREDSEYVLYLDAGDLFSGNPVVDISYGAPIIDLMNTVGLDAMAVGNHDFDYGQDHFARNMADSDFQWLSANMEVVDSSIPITQTQPYAIFEMDELKVGVLALTQAPPETKLTGIAGLAFQDYAATIERYTHLRDDVDVLVGLTHIGIEDDRLIAEQFDLFDLIIGGHTSVALSRPEVINDTLVVQAGSHLEYIGKVTIELDRDTKEVLEIDGRLQSVNELKQTVQAVQEKIERYQREMEGTLEQVIGFTATGLTGEGGYEGDAPIGNFWTDAMRNMFDTEIAVTNNGGIRNVIDAGDITLGDIYEIEPFQNHVMIMDMTGQALYDVIMYSYTREERNQIDIQTSGLHYTIVTDESGQFKTAHLTVEGEPVDPKRVYTVAVPDFIGTGGSGYRFEGKVIQPNAGILTQALINYTEKLMSEKEAVNYGSEGRIQIRKED